MYSPVSRLSPGRACAISIASRYFCDQNPASLARILLFSVTSLCPVPFKCSPTAVMLVPWSFWCSFTQAPKEHAVSLMYDWPQEHLRPYTKPHLSVNLVGSYSL